MRNIIHSVQTDPTSALCRALFELARKEDDLAAAEAATVRYWEPCPTAVHGHRVAADVLRDYADGLSRSAWILHSQTEAQDRLPEATARLSA